MGTIPSFVRSQNQKPATRAGSFNGNNSERPAQIGVNRVDADMSGAIVSGEFNSPVLLEAEQKGYLVLRKPLEPAKLYALLTQRSGCR
ncbi:hypothetical protein EKN57_00435 [Enterobacter hormaechei]|nr:hypothetical protein EKN57_00435 [Enterobacter hormaechei]